MEEGSSSEYENLARTSLYVPVADKGYLGDSSYIPSTGSVESSSDGYIGAGNSDVSANLSRATVSAAAGYSELKSSKPAVATAAFSSPSPPSSSFSGSVLAGSTWNSEFQQLQEIESDSPERWQALSALAHDFFATAQHYAAIIVSEFHLEDHARTIRQCKTIGGTAGGLKFVASGILFKFAHDPLLSSDRHLYSGGSEPDTEAAAKALGNELKVKEKKKKTFSNKNKRELLDIIGVMFVDCIFRSWQ